ncbi:hypothetical protein KIH39_06395 [Telmatocola sphagniphila]|uniref:Uncharacterized protein n=1 Tax=Telmatocola sphagniphila TaxID=1123043 RepID=A0A8E6EZJ5_9BACT|nr:hypothetical protein [Telmatocola sphagniphila]QVL33536.1 hypothetical protein KIH39_06395 [Telmatocola sphagniphila]
MSNPSQDEFRNGPSDMDRILREHLDREASKVDVDTIWSQVNSRLESDSTRISVEDTKKTSRKRRGWPYSIGLVASVILLCSVLITTNSVSATPSQLVEKIREEIPVGQDASYRLQVELSPIARELFPHLGDSVIRQISTRGVRFLVEPGLGGHGVWGRDGLGRVWLAPRKDSAIRFEETELPKPLRNLVNTIGLELRPLLDEVLVDFDLSWGEKQENGLRSIEANRRGVPGIFGVRKVTLLINETQNRIVSLRATRILPGGHTAEVRMEFLGFKDLTEADYVAETHIEEGAKVSDRTHPIQRRQLMLQYFGQAFPPEN